VTQIMTGGWVDVPGNGIARADTAVPIGCCRTCGHVQVTMAYTPDFLAGLYGSDRIQGDDLPANAGPATVRFCQPEILMAQGLIIDLGCGRGALLGCLSGLYGLPAERLLGVDFRNALAVPVPFRPADLNRLEDGALADLAGGAGFLFCTHVLEHMLDPRAFLRGAATLLASDGHLYVEVPDFEGVDPATLHHLPLVNPQHIHYFTARSLRLLVESCGFSVVRLERRGALCLLARRYRPAGAAHVAAFSAETLARRRRALAETIADVMEGGGPVGLWGLGADFARMLETCPRFRQGVETGRASLFDLLQAGRRYAGITIRHPDAIDDFDGPVYLLPSIHLVADRMRAYAAARTGWPPHRLIDPWGAG